jgi:hypothetical protein
MSGGRGEAEQQPAQATAPAYDGDNGVVTSPGPINFEKQQVNPCEWEWRQFMEWSSL